MSMVTISQNFQPLCLPTSTLVIAADPTHKDAKMKLAEIYEILDQPRKALELVTQGMQIWVCVDSFIDWTPSDQLQKTKESAGEQAR